MATWVSAEGEAESGHWWNYFFLYDGSKVKEEGDPTRAGICYFYPTETVPDHQELLCGQIAGVAHCVSEISGSPPTLVRLRRLKFALKGDGDFLWALGCAMELPDVSCQHLLHHLIGFFRFYNGPVSLAYKSQAWEKLGRKWDVYIRHIQNATGDVHRIFQALGNLDKTQVEPLLLLKAALILQTCQRCPHVLAGCILYRGLVVSTQLAPSLTARILTHRTSPEEQKEEAPEDAGPRLPPDVQIIPVFLTQDEADALRDFPLEWRRRWSSPAPPAHHGEESLPALPSPQPGGPQGTEAEARSRESPVAGEAQHPDPERPNGPGAAPREAGLSPWPDPGLLPEDFGASAEAGRGRGDPVSGASPDEDVGCWPETPESQERWSEGVPDGHFPACPPPGRLPRSPVPQRAASDGGDQPGPTPFPLEAEGPPPPPAEVKQPQRPEGAAGGAALVKMSLYVHRVGGLLLTLLAEQPLRTDSDATEEVYYSSLASLNGLEVHLRESRPRAQPFSARAAYSFAHYDRIQNMLTANLPRGPTAQDRHFLRAAGLAHTDFARLPTLYEVTLRNASTTVYACRNAAHETYFQQPSAAGAARGCGFPNPQDGLCALAARAKQKMMRHGVNLL
ncbi:Hermansky-Pudlak syndrome 4 protein [Tachyglossus aculeatus]|uniref:Hermansky-Pudlak syndrome 4 protein n=1 Tax=Tachyglossus aculeatus TaxID=9261 RepID=UPI0018F5B88C|nr:Hermansky-Pudlak syndrome 4 protein [Tachyglossus aculeatus]